MAAMGCGCPERRVTRRLAACLSPAGQLVAAAAAHPLHRMLGLPPWPAGALAALRQKKMYEGQLEQVGWRSLLPLAIVPCTHAADVRVCAHTCTIESSCEGYGVSHINTAAHPHCRPQIDNSLARLGEQRAALENLSAQAEVINALKVGADASKGAMQVRGRSGCGCWSLVLCLMAAAERCRCLQGVTAACQACASALPPDSRPRGHLYCAGLLLAAGHSSASDQTLAGHPLLRWCP